MHNMASILGSGSVHHQGRRRMVRAQYTACSARQPPSSSTHFVFLCGLGAGCCRLRCAAASRHPACHQCRLRQLLCFETLQAMQRLSTRIQLQAPSLGGGNAGVVCQRCLQTGHWTYECKNAPVYKARPTRTQQLMQPKVRWRRLSLVNAADVGMVSFANGGSGATLDPASGSGRSEIGLWSSSCRPACLPPIWCTELRARCSPALPWTR